MRFFLPALLAAWLSCETVVAVPEGFRSALTDRKNKWDPDTSIFLPSSEGFSDATYRWSVFEPPTYKIAITPATEADVQTAVRVARRFKVPFLATGGRHGISTTLGLLDDGLAIDLSLLNSVTVDSEAGTANVGGGARFEDSFEPIFAAGYQLPVGASPCPGMLGATVGGGIGREQGIHGLIMDNLVSVRLVTAKGDLVVASEDSNPDLFWGVRGAGANFGIITSATYSLWPLVNNGMSLSADFVIPPSMNGSYMDIIGSLEDAMPPELGVISIINYNETAGEPQIIANWVYFGPEDEGMEIIAPVLELDLVRSSISMVPWNTLVSTALFSFSDLVCMPGGVHSAFGLNFRDLSPETYKEMFQKMADYYDEAADAAGRTAIFELENFSNDKVMEVPDDATAYPWRDSRGLILLSFGADDLGQRTAREIRSACVATSGYDSLHVYSSVAHGDETPEELFGHNLPRLVKLKKKWDPHNVFAYMHALPTSY